MLTSLTTPPSQHARVAVRVEECLCCSKELNMAVLERETDMAVRCEPERCGLEELEEQQDQLEVTVRGERENEPVAKLPEKPTNRGEKCQS